MVQMFLWSVYLHIQLAHAFNGIIKIALSESRLLNVATRIASGYSKRYFIAWHSQSGPLQCMCISQLWLGIYSSVLHCQLSVDCL